VQAKSLKIGRRYFQMKNMSIKKSILLPALAVLVAGIVIMVIIVGSVSSQTASDLTEKFTSATVDKYTCKFEALCMESYGLAVSLAPTLETISHTTENSREEAISSMAGILLASDDIVSVWTCWEPNAFDGKDSEYRSAPNHDATGRFIPYLCKDGSSYTVGYVPDYEEGDYYLGPRGSGKPYITDPYECDFGGDVISVYTISIPIMKKGVFAGAVGIDISLEAVAAFINESTILDNGYVFLLSPGGLFAAHRNNDLMLASYETTWLAGYKSEMSSLQANGGAFTVRGYSDQLDQDIRFLGSGVMIGDTGRYWTVGGIATEKDINASSNRLIGVVVAIGFALILVTGLTILLIIRRRLQRLPVITAAAEAMAKGELNLTDMDTGTGPTKNEIVLLGRAFTTMAESIKGQCAIMTRLAAGDYSTMIPVRSEVDAMNKAINVMIDRTNEVMDEIRASSGQVSSGAKQMADGAQALAQSSTEQAATVQQLSSAISEISQKTRDNAEMAGLTAGLTGTIKQGAEKGSRHMDEMMAAVKDINEASHSISKVIKVIDDIAFQTNILALNAAVEAARAGQHGKGFAVVADEVRNLAAKSAEAAKETGELIENSMEKAELGARIAGETAASLTEIVSGINEAGGFVEAIARTSNEQSEAIAEINTGVDQVAQVVQQNSATAEESAAASEEMSGQSEMLAQLIAQFKLKNTKGLPQPSGDDSHRIKSHAAKTAFALIATDGGAGKY